MVEHAALLLQEYQEVNAHLRVNTNQFVNWFSFFLTLRLFAAVMFVVAPDYRPVLGKFAHRYAVQLVFLLMHIPAFIGILTFRRYILAADRKVEAITQQLGHSGDSPRKFAGVCARSRLAQTFTSQMDHRGYRWNLRRPPRSHLGLPPSSLARFH